MPDGTIEPKKGRKFDQVLEGARQVFMSDGFEGASVDDIARAANVSKATLYSYFPDKRLMFTEMAEREWEGRRFRLREFHYGGERVWGATAYMLLAFRNFVLNK